MEPVRMREFYALLGFSLSDLIYDARRGADKIVEVQFMHCNGRHHSLATATAPAPVKLLHFMLQVQQFDDVGHALDRVDAHAIKLSLSMGRHVNDHMVSFYAFTPSGFEVEYGWGARTVDAAWTPVRHDRISAWGHKTINLPGTGWKY
jgi:biphenyl-2,3-diol 1,2-dioxygenase